MSGFPLSKYAPAGKSAQIISRQYPRDLSVPSIKAAVSIACSMTHLAHHAGENLSRVHFQESSLHHVQRLGRHGENLLIKLVKPTKIIWRPSH